MTASPKSPNRWSLSIGDLTQAAVFAAPCVVGADGSLTGYAGGIGTKESLLRIEGVLGA